MSSDPEQEYFSDGISEEILNVLAKIPNLQVTSRSSAFAYKGKDNNIQEVAKVLGVKNVLEGSVRKSGTRVRITAQLINADTDKYLWSESYDRELDDIFKVQDEISAAIVKSLKITLGITLVKATYTPQTINSAAHDYYLQGLRSIRVSTFDSLTEAVIAFESAIKIAPDFLPAKIKLAETFSMQVDIGSRFDLEILDTADEMINQVLVTSPHSADAYYVRAWIASRKNERELAKQYAKEAYRLNPNDADIVVAHAQFNGAVIGEKKVRALFKRAQQMDPFNGEIPHQYGMYLLETI
ncbi:MAG: TolB-like protein [Candidatus Azotimanducaceae bacterium]|jgi:TolB-like protein